MEYNLTDGSHRTRKIYRMNIYTFLIAWRFVKKYDNYPFYGAIRMNWSEWT